jgi:hypothetical protein
MLAAILKGKVPSQFEGMEDVLTSVVVGAFELLSFDEGFGPWLGGATSLAGDALPMPQTPDGVGVHLWPWCKDCDGYGGTEPDAALWLRQSTPGAPTSLSVLEAKWRSKMLALRVIRANGWWDDFWQPHAA